MVKALENSGLEIRELSPERVNWEISASAASQISRYLLSETSPTKRRSG
jgi:hypothetical protein